MKTGIHARVVIHKSPVKKLVPLLDPCEWISGCACRKVRPEAGFCLVCCYYCEEKRCPARCKKYPKP